MQIHETKSKPKELKHHWSQINYVRVHSSSSELPDSLTPRRGIREGITYM